MRPIALLSLLVVGCTAAPEMIEQTIDPLVWPTNATQFEATSRRVYGSSCPDPLSRWAINTTAREVTMSRCRLGQDFTYATEQITRQLSSTELESLEAALSALTRSERALCGADKDVQLITTNGATFKDDFYACEEHGLGTTLVAEKDINAVFMILESL